MDMKHSIQQMELKLKHHHLVSSYHIESKYDEKAEREYILLKLWMVQLRDSTSEFTNLLKMVRTAVPRQFKVKVRLQTEI